MILSLEYILIATKISIIGNNTPPTMMNVVPDVGGLTKFDTTPGGGIVRGYSARTESGMFSRDDMIEMRFGKLEAAE